MDLDMILKEWEEDCQINQMDITGASIDAVRLHSKYLRRLARAKLKLRSLKSRQAELLKNKWLWYNGKMTKEQMDSLGWDYDPMKGLKVLKGDMDRFYEADPDISASEDEIKYVTTCVETLTEIVDTLKWRHQHIKNIITWKKFEHGE